jgi:TolB protein
MPSRCGSWTRKGDAIFRFLKTAGWRDDAKVVKITASCLLVCTAMAAVASAGQQKIAFLGSKDRNTMWIANLDGTKARRFPSNWSGPEVSPDGTWLAFTIVSETPETHLAATNLVTRKTTFFKDVPGRNCGGPVWSHHGDQISFGASAGGIWDLTIMKSDGTDVHSSRALGGHSSTLYSYCWGPDDASFIVQDMYYLYQFSHDGKLIKEWDIKKLTGSATMTSSSRLDLSPDARRLVFDAGFGPTESIYVLDLEKETAKPIPIAKGFFASQPQWLNDDELVCKVASEDNTKIGIYRLKTDGAGQTLVMKNAWWPSVSRLP